MSLRVRIVASILGLCFAACGNSPPSSRGPTTPVAPLAPSADAGVPPSEPPDSLVPKLRTGSLEPVDDPTVHELRVTSRYAADGYETLAVVLKTDGSEASVFHGGGDRTPVEIDFPPGQPTPLAFVSPSASNLWHEGARDAAVAKGFGVLWIRRALPASSAPITGTLFEVPNPDHGTPGTVHHFRVVAGIPLPNDPKTWLNWLHALSSDAIGPLHTAWSSFSATRLEAMAAALEPARKAPLPVRGSRPIRPSEPRTDLATFMGTTTGATAIQEALQTDRSLFARVAREPANIPIVSLKGPELAVHPWKTMLARVGAPAPEPLASNVPAEFYYVRSTDLPSLYRVLDQVDAWGTPAATVLDGAYEERGLASRYETALALKRGPLTRLLGSAVVGEVAVVGSDPYVKEGSDVTVLLQVKSRPLLEAAMSAVLTELEREHGTLLRSKRAHDGIDVSTSLSPDGAVAQERATVGDLEIVSNSPTAIDAVLDACKGLRPRLADELDFQYMLARDRQVPADVLGYMGDSIRRGRGGAQAKGARGAPPDSSRGAHDPWVRRSSVRLDAGQKPGHVGRPVLDVTAREKRDGPRGGCTHCVASRHPCALVVGYARCAYAAHRPAGPSDGDGLRAGGLRVVRARIRDRLVSVYRPYRPPGRLRAQRRAPEDDRRLARAATHRWDDVSGGRRIRRGRKVHRAGSRRRRSLCGRYRPRGLAAP